jgi:streptogramin lyase
MGRVMFRSCDIAKVMVACGLLFCMTSMVFANDEFPIPQALGKASAIVAGVNSDLWFTLPTSGQIGRITTSGTMTYNQLAAGSAPEAIALAADGTVWFTDPGLDQIGYLNQPGAPVVFNLAVGSAPSLHYS